MPSSTPPSSLFETDASRWAALQSRNTLAASAFVYCVTSTNICCRPTCKARLARRSNVIFHNTYAEASAAGFRACKRCKPELLTEHDPQADVVARACRAIEDAEMGMTSVKLGDLAKEVGLTKSHFHRVFKKFTGVTPRIYAVNVRAERMLDGSVAVTPELVGSVALTMDGSDGVWTPGAQREGSLEGADGDLLAPETQNVGIHAVFQPGVDYLHPGFTGTARENCALKRKIEYTIQPWASGYVLIAATRDGICWLEGGHAATELSLSLAHKFPLADLHISEWSTDVEFGKRESGNHGMFATVMEALVRPTGKVLDVPVNIYRDLHI